jgi:hypothetical protein
LELGEASIGEPKRGNLRFEQVEVRRGQLRENLDASYARVQRPSDGGGKRSGIERVEARFPESFGFHAVT